MRRVVVTGIGLVSPLACGTDLTWSRLIEGKSGLGPIKSFDPSKLSSRIAGEVPRDEGVEGSFIAEDHISTKEQRRMDTFIQYGLVAADFAIADSGWQPTDEESLEKTGVLIGSGIGGLPEIEKGANTVHDGNLRRLSPFFIPASLINLTSGQVAIKHGFKGPNHAVVTACSSGAHAIGDAARIIMWEDADVMIAGGTEAAICELGVHGFAQARALSTGFNDTPEKASRPWDVDRDGFVIGEGAGIVVLEEYEHA
ncbi:MAG: beta-ketoacyl-ACP synthase II, partial [Rhodospirillaceae bacterium]|nr:beta-ketoacyl-ACP synthase II [Rhodospirillaceae bacterium]